ncbi:MAG: dihydrodipicolinate synthase family protein [Anaerolineales bacterium]|nr:dihydrodipicolinate synthase family protein [Anaerolineales bacterium]MCB8959524.1 dihydrodipicolinate synthase family protein [Ardenticatenales bacterium]MCB0006971.1 dihydrodipicolinate synthase family protein [Anaerolineales bacterium]MCB0010627.1 dihydrodipicolinate synthase family protein [Anaerolineales bacterium]MCB0016993.1 dihydrodipicolinate synthase family protein [Anaerolineales bacterium]
MMSKINSLRNIVQDGVAPAMATPLQGDGRTVNLAVVPELIDFLGQRNVRGVFVGGTTGEGLFLDASERLKLHEAAVTAAGDLPVLLHVGANDTPTTQLLIKQAVELEVAAIVIIPPTFLAMNDNHLVDYLAEVAAGAPDTPMLVYDIPQAAVNGVTPRMVEMMEARIPSFAGLKCSRLDAQVIRSLIDALSEDRIFLAGNERIAVGSLMMGATGMISGLATAVPEPFVGLTAAIGAGDLAAAKRWHNVINRMLDEIPAGCRIGTIKTVLNQRGIAVGNAVPPRPMPPAGDYWQRMRAHLPV